jgi:hypothetical protein
MRSTALPAELAPVKLAPPLIAHASREALCRFARERVRGDAIRFAFVRCLGASGFGAAAQRVRFLQFVTCPPYRPMAETRWSTVCGPWAFIVANGALVDR